MRAINLVIIFLIIGSLSAPAQNESQIYISKSVDGTIETVKPKLEEALKAEKFGVITEVDMSKTLKEKLNEDIMPYLILGVCNAGHAFEALKAEENIGVFLPCKVILKQVESNKVEVVAVNPALMMQMIGNDKLNPTAEAVTTQLRKVISSL